MSTQNINNLRNTIKDFPKLYEWELLFENLPDAIKEIIPSASFVVLTEGVDLPGITLSHASATYKGAVMNFTARMKLAGTTELTFKEIKIDDESFIVRDAIQKWIELEDSFFGTEKLPIASYKITAKLSMQDEQGDSFYKVRYFGFRPKSCGKIELNYDVPEGEVPYPVFKVVFAYDYWTDLDDGAALFGPA
jgi:hypothetical protein